MAGLAGSATSMAVRVRVCDADLSVGRCSCALGSATQPHLIRSAHRERRKCWHLFLVLVVALLLASPSEGFCSEVKTRQELFAAAIRQRSAEWAPGVVEQWAKDVDNLLTELLGEVSQEQVDEICAGLRAKFFAAYEVINVDRHPLTREFSRQKLLFAVRNDVSYRNKDRLGSEQFLKQVDGLLSGVRKDAAARLPEARVIVDKGLTLARRHIAAGSLNPFARSGKRGVPEKTLERTRRALAGLSAKWPAKVSASRVRDDVRGAVGATMGRESCGESGPKPEGLVVAKKECVKHRREITTWFITKRTERTNRDMALRRHQGTFPERATDEPFRSLLDAGLPPLLSLFGEAEGQKQVGSSVPNDKTSGAGNEEGHR